MSASGKPPRRSRFVVSRLGTCSFCGRHDDEVSAFAEIASRPYRICGECLGLCLDVTCELDKRAEREALAAQLASLTTRRAFSERLEPKLLSGDIDGVVEVMREFGYGDVDPDQVRALLDSLRNRPSCSVGTRLPGSAAGDKCSFCDSVRDEVTKFVLGPAGAKICDRCVDDASADVLAVLVTT